MEGYRFFCTFSNANGAESTAEAVLHIIYQGKELEIPENFRWNLVPGYYPDDYGWSYYPSAVG